MWLILPREVRHSFASIPYFMSGWEMSVPAQTDFFYQNKKRAASPFLGLAVFTYAHFFLRTSSIAPISRKLADMAYTKYAPGPPAVGRCGPPSIPGVVLMFTVTGVAFAQPARNSPSEPVCSSENSSSLCVLYSSRPGSLSTSSSRGAVISR